MTGAWCLVQGWGGFFMLPGVFLLLLGLALHPRLNRLPKEEDDGVVLRRPDAPELFALIAEASGTRGVDAVAVNAETNASVQTYGLRGRLLTLGLPLWEPLTPEHRIALLGHELGHYSNGDARRGLVLGPAYRSLGLWLYYLSPIANPTNAVHMITNLAYVVPRLLVQGVLTDAAENDYGSHRIHAPGEMVTLPDSIGAKVTLDVAAILDAGQPNRTP
ncbi:M48 family metallopeptidase [Streptomyces sp. QTS52]